LRAGAIREGVAVTAIVPAGSEVSVRAGESECRAGVVVLATNGYTSLLLPQVKIQPTRAQMLASAPLSRSVCDMPTYSHFGYRYWRQLASGEVLIGGWRDTSLETEKTLDDNTTSEIQDHLDGKLGELDAKAEVTNRWAGTMGFTETGLPLVGPVDGMKNVYTCAGFNGHGMGFAFMSAKQLVESL
jgi:glycine/D-amino acid oxidase-like deaminating enzyme